MEEDSQIESKLPIDIIKVANSLGIEIVPGILNFGKKEYIAKLQLEIDEDKNSVRKEIIIDEESFRLPYSNLERFAIAREIGKIIVHGDDYNLITTDFINKANMLPSPYPSISRLIPSIESFEYEMCAVFLLFPMREFFQLFSETFESLHPANITDGIIINELEKKAAIPYYQFAINYNWFKFFAHQYYLENIAYETSEEAAKEYAKLFQ